MASNPFSAWPLSGDVAQAWASFFKSMSQVGLVNIVQQMRTEKPDLEQKIVTEGFSYGRQLGRIVDALEVLIRHGKDVGLDGILEPEEKKSFEQFAEMAAKIDELKVGGVPLGEEDLDAFVRRMKILKERDPKVYRNVRKQIDRLQERLRADDGPQT